MLWLAEKYMKKSFLCLVLLCLAFPLLNSSCKKKDIIESTRVYFTYGVGYYGQLNGNAEQCTAGDGVCDFAVRNADWRPADGVMPDGQGFGYLTLTTDLKLRMVIYMPFLSLSTYKAHYADGVASLPGPWKLALGLTAKLGIIDGYTVSMGDYTVGMGTEDGYDVLIVQF